MPYCAPSVKGTQCQAYSCEPSRRGSGLPPQPGISSLVLRGASRGSNKRYLIVCISTCHWINSESTASSGPEVITSLRNKGSGSGGRRQLAVSRAFPWDRAPRYLMRDRDTSYG